MIFVLGGSIIGRNQGYGPARYLTPEEVMEVAEAIAGLDDEVIRSCWNPAAMEEAEIYPGDWGGDDALPWLMDSLHKLREFYSIAASRGSAVLIYLA